MDGLNNVDLVIIEDNPYDSEIILRVLRKTGLCSNPLLLSDGKEAMDFLNSTGNYSTRNPNLTAKAIILDLNLPFVSGHEILKHIRMTPGLQSCPVIILSSSLLEADIRKCYELMANSFIVKPLEYEKFSASIEAIGYYWLKMNHVS
jgi:two-component system, response regulator